MAQHFTDQDFQKEVFEAKGLVMVDFWAEWCVDPQTQILDASGFIKPARTVQATDSLTAYSGRKIEKDNVVLSFTSNKLGHCAMVKTESGRAIRVTDNHLFFTKDGWKEAGSLKENDDVAIYPHPEASQDDDEKLLVWARIVGLAFSDGNLYFSAKNHYYEVTFFLGQKEDMDMLIADLKFLGFRPTGAKRRVTQRTIHGRTFISRTFRAKYASKALYEHLKKLGVPSGHKGNAQYRVPGWILRGSKSIKREFLAGYLGGDGPKIKMSLYPRSGKEPYNALNINDIEFYKKVDVLKSGLQFAQDLKKLFTGFGVKISSVFPDEETFHRKDGTAVKSIHLAFQNNFENASRLFFNIGYRYAKQKYSESANAAEFIRRILEKRKAWVSQYEKVLLLNKEQGFGYRKLSRLLKLPAHTVWLWLKKGVQPHIKKHFLKFPAWLKAHKKGLRDGLLWDRITEIQKIYLESVQKITMQKYPNFIANGFLSHNCGPCRMMGPVVEALAEEMKGKVKIGKMDVDANPTVPGSFGISSIPTTIFFKDGQEVDRLVGYQGKDALVKKINAHL